MQAEEGGAVLVPRTAVVAEARKHLGAKWVHQGRRSGEALDCLGLLVVVAKALGLSQFDLRDYDRMPDGRLLTIMRRELRQIPRSTIAPGDVVALSYDRGPSHVGIVTDYRQRADALGMIHGSSIRGAVCEHRIDGPTRDLISAAFHVPGVEET